MTARPFFRLVSCEPVELDSLRPIEDPECMRPPRSVLHAWVTRTKWRGCPPLSRFFSVTQSFLGYRRREVELEFWSSSFFYRRCNCDGDVSAQMPQWALPSPDLLSPTVRRQGKAELLADKDASQIYCLRTLPLLLGLFCSPLFSSCACACARNRDQ
jgi:hypothetical protein